MVTGNLVGLTYRPTGIEGGGTDSGVWKDDWGFSLVGIKVTKQMSRCNNTVMGGPPRDAEFNNVAVQKTLAVCGRVTTQELEAIDLTVLDLSTLTDVVVTGNLEVDGTSLFSGAATFNSPVTFNSTVTIAGTTVIPVTQTSLTITPVGVTGVVILTRQANVVDITFLLTNSSGGAIAQGTVLFTVPATDLPVGSLFAVGNDPTTPADTAGFELAVPTGEVTLSANSSPFVAWANNGIRSGHFSYITV